VTAKPCLLFMFFIFTLVVATAHREVWLEWVRLAVEEFLIQQVLLVH